MPCYWYLLGNPSPIDNGGTIKVHPTDTATCVVDLCGVITTDTVKVFTHPAGISSQKFSAVNIYPNPASDFLTIENGEGTDAMAFDLLGHEVLSTSITSMSFS